MRPAMKQEKLETQATMSVRHGGSLLRNSHITHEEPDNGEEKWKLELNCNSIVIHFLKEKKETILPRLERRWELEAATLEKEKGKRRSGRKRCSRLFHVGF